MSGGSAQSLIETLSSANHSNPDLSQTVLHRDATDDPLHGEQNAKFATRLSDRAYILEKGHVRFSGSIEALHANDDVRRQYLGL